jgi:hypothetical protein
MKYINVYEIANFINFNDLNITTFKKFKRRLSAEFELNDGEIFINGISISQSEMYEILDSVDRNKNLLNIYKSLYENKELNKFLMGKFNYNEIKRLKYLLSLENNKTIKFITPYLINSLSKLYKDAFLDNKIEILKIEPPISKYDYEKIYEPIYKILEDKKNELLKFENDAFNLNDVKNILGDLATLNSLPEYFTKIRNDIAYSIRNLSVNSWNDKEDLELSMDLIDYALKIKVNSKTKEKFLSDKNELGNIFNEKNENKRTEKIIIIDTILKSPNFFFQKALKILHFIDNLDYSEKNKLAIPIHNLIINYLTKNPNILKSTINTTMLKIIFKRFSYTFKDDIDTLDKVLSESDYNVKKYGISGAVIGAILGPIIFDSSDGIFWGGFIGFFLGAMFIVILMVWMEENL